MQTFFVANKVDVDFDRKLDERKAVWHNTKDETPRDAARTVARWLYGDLLGEIAPPGRYEFVVRGVDGEEFVIEVKVKMSAILTTEVVRCEKR